MGEGSGPAVRGYGSASSAFGDRSHDGDGEVLERARIANGVDRLAEVMARAGEITGGGVGGNLRLVLGGRRVAGQGARVHLAHPLGVKAFEYRRVKNDERDAADLADLLRMGRLPESWIAPPPVRELRELVRHRAKLVGLRSHCKAEVHAVLAKCGVAVPMTDLFGVGGTDLLDRLRLPTPYASRIESLRRMMEALEFEIERVLHDRERAADPRSRLRGGADRSPGSVRCWGRCSSPRSATSAGSTRPEQLTCWAGLTPKHHESDTHVHRGRITKQGSRLVRWAAVESVADPARDQRGRADPRPGRCPPRPQHRRRRGRPPTAGIRLLCPAGPPRPRPGAS